MSLLPSDNLTQERIDLIFGNVVQKQKKLMFLVENIEANPTGCTRMPGEQKEARHQIQHMLGTFLASRLICAKVHGPPPLDKPYALHLCGNDWCLTPEHLEWDTLERNGLHRKLQGTDVKLTYQEVLEIIDLKKGGVYTLDKIAKLYGVSASMVSQYASGAYVRMKPLERSASEKRPVIPRDYKII